MLPFDLIFPDLAAEESRYFKIFDHPEVPHGDYVFQEFYCNDPGCDCRRVILHLYWAEKKKVVATINYAFEPPDPIDPPQIFLDPLGPQSIWSEVFLRMFAEMVRTDRPYHDRLVRHYEMWKRVVDDPSHPSHRKVRSKHHGDRNFKPAFPQQKPIRREGPKIGPNDPCPCGSGKKLKKCCRKV